MHPARPAPPARRRGRLRALAPLLLAALLVPVPHGSAQSSSASEPNHFAITRTSLEGSHLSVHATSSGQPMFLEMATLNEGGAKVADDVAVHQWVFTEGIQLSFELTRETSSASLTLVHRDGEQKRRQETHTLTFPTAPAEDDLRRVEVWDAARTEDGRALVLLRNTGERPIERVRLSLQDPSGAYAGAPFVQQLTALGVEEEAWLSFELTWTGNPYTLTLQYANRTETARVHLRAPTEDQASEEDPPTFTLRTDFPARESEPGGAPAYVLRLSNEGAEALVTLRATGLPEGFSASFVVQGSRASSFRVPEAASRDVTMNLNVPASASSLVGRTIPLGLEALVEGEPVASADLTLSIQGVGRLEVSGENWFVEAKPSEPTRVPLTLSNPGTAPLLDVVPASSVPSGWQVSFQPGTLARIGAGEAEQVVMTITPPADVGPGRYVLDVSAGNTDVSARARSLTASVTKSEASALPWIAAAGIGGVLALGLIIKLRRK